MINLHFGTIKFSSGCPLIGFVLTACLLMVSCKKTESVSMDHLYGRWEIAKAERNGKETSYLRNGYFIVEDNGTMTINITGEDESGNFMLEGNQLNMGNDKRFDIVSLQPDSMVVRYETASNSLFTFFMVKKNEDTQ